MNSMRSQIVDLPSGPEPRLEDVATPEGVVLALYDVISGPCEQERERDWDRLRSLFAPRATFRLTRWLGPDGVDEELREWSVEEFVDAGRLQWQADGFWEREIWSRTDRYGNIAHVLSTYEGRVGSPDSDPVTRGVNSFQLIRAAERWWLASTVWDIETAHNAIPPELLRRSGSVR